MQNGPLAQGKKINVLLVVDMLITDQFIHLKCQTHDTTVDKLIAY